MNAAQGAGQAGRKWLAAGASSALALLLGASGLLSSCANSGVIRELREDPLGERASKVMLLTLPSGREIPVNYLREGDTVYAAADFPWWRELRGDGGRGRVLIRGETLKCHIRAVEDDPALRASVFERLRPTAPSWTGTLVVVELD